MPAALAALLLLAPAASAAQDVSLSLLGLHVSIPARPVRDPQGIEVGTASGDLLRLRNPALASPRGLPGVAPQSAGADASGSTSTTGSGGRDDGGTPALLGPAGFGLWLWMAAGLAVLGLALALRHRRKVRRQARMDARIAALRAELDARDRAHASRAQARPA